MVQAATKSMIKLLGAKLDVDDLDPSFVPPADSNQKIQFVLDVCHMH
jgi:hypothetical protein